jgi:hypothetical protein
MLIDFFSKTAFKKSKTGKLGWGPKALILVPANGACSLDYNNNNFS